MQYNKENRFPFMTNFIQKQGNLNLICHIKETISIVKYPIRRVCRSEQATKGFPISPTRSINLDKVYQNGFPFIQILFHECFIIY